MRRTTSLTAAGLLALALLAPATGPSAAAATCLGRTATIVEDVTLVAPSVRILGDDESNTFGSTACFAKLDGNGGDDYLANRPRSYFEAYTFDCVASSRMHGGSGADRLVDSHGTGALHGGPGHDSLLGRGGEDQLDGGRGRDRADGGTGRDRCAAERERRCER
jgi:Ca2+-binding RTX toxin-like protein